MDFLGSVHGSPKTMLVLTLQPIICFTLFFPIESPSSKNVIEAFNSLEKDLGTENFKKLFEAVVTDRDTKFNDINGFETNPKTGEHRSNLFFCV